MLKPKEIHNQNFRLRKTMTYTFERLLVFTFQGVSSGALPKECQITIPDAIYSCTVTPVSYLGDYLLHADQEQAVFAGMLRGVTYEDDRFAAQLAEVRAARPNAAGYVILSIRGPAELDMSQAHRDIGRVVVGFDLADKDEYRRKTQHLSSAVGTALALVSHPGRGEKVVDSVYFFDEGGRAHYVSNPRFGTPTVSLSWGTNQLDTFALICRAAAEDETLGRSIRLLASSLNPEKDRFEKFVLLWTALEVLVNKLFPCFRERFAKATVGRPQLSSDVEERVFDDKAKLMDKFIVTASYLRPYNVPEDVNAFASIKHLRDSLIHTGESADEGLPLEAVTEMLVQYLSSYLKDTSTQGSCPTSV
jgi:hypothetical protein